MGKKVRLAVAAALALLVLLAFGLGYKGWDATEFASEALERFETEAGWKLEAESARQFDPAVVAAMVELVRAEGPNARSRRRRSSDGAIPVMIPPEAGAGGRRPAAGA